MLTEIHYHQIIKDQLTKLNQQREMIQSAYNALNNLAEQDGFLDVGDEDDYYCPHIRDIATIAAKERTAIDKYLRGEIYAD